VLAGDPAPPRKGAQQPPLFGPCLLWFKWSPISVTAELLFGIWNSQEIGTSSWDLSIAVMVTSHIGLAMALVLCAVGAGYRKVL